MRSKSLGNQPRIESNLILMESVWMQCISPGWCLNHGVTMRGLLQTVVDGLGPHERLVVLVLEPNELVDRRPQLRHAVEDASPHARALTEPPRDEVQSRGTRRRTVQMQSWRSRHPLLDMGVVVRPAIVQDQVAGLPWRHVSVDDVQELQPLLVAMARITGADHGAVEHSARREQAGGAVGLVVMRQGAASPFFIGMPGCVRSNAWTCGCSSTPTTSVNVSTPRVSSDSLNVSIRCGCKRCAS